MKQKISPELKAFLTAVKKAQQANERAKNTVCNGVHFSDYESDSYYARANYHRSRMARARRYEEKERFLREAVTLAIDAKVMHGVRDDVIYFDLESGQISFHFRHQLGCIFKYEKPFDGVVGQTLARIEAAKQIANGKFSAADWKFAEETLREQKSWAEFIAPKHFGNLNGEPHVEICEAGYPANKI